MTTIILNWDLNENFWDSNRIFLEHSVFNNFYKKDKTKKKEESSNIMWGIAMLVDPNEKNIYKNLPLHQKKQVIEGERLKKKNFNWDHPDIKKLINLYVELCTTPFERHLMAIEKKLEERENFIKGTPYTLDVHNEMGKIISKGTAKELDLMLAQTKKILDLVEDMKAQISKESGEQVLKAGKKKSASEKGEI